MSYFLRHMPYDLTHVNVNHYYDLQYWMNRFSVTEDKLREALKEVGPVTADIEEYLVQKRYYSLSGSSGSKSA